MVRVFPQETGSYLHMCPGGWNFFYFIFFGFLVVVVVLLFVVFDSGGGSCGMGG